MSRFNFESHEISNKINYRGRYQIYDEIFSQICYESLVDIERIISIHAMEHIKYNIKFDFNY